MENTSTSRQYDAMGFEAREYQSNTSLKSPVHRGNVVPKRSGGPKLGPPMCQKALISLRKATAFHVGGPNLVTQPNRQNKILLLTLRLALWRLFGVFAIAVLRMKSVPAGGGRGGRVFRSLLLGRRGCGEGRSGLDLR